MIQPSSDAKDNRGKLTISLIIPAYNEEKYIWPCLEYVFHNTEGHINEIIVIDNASTDNTRKIVETYPGVKIVTEYKKWLVFARDRGHKESTGDILAFIDADTRMPKWRAKKLRHHFESRDDIWFVSGPYRYYDLHRYGRLVNRIYRKIGYLTYLLTWYLWVGGNFAIRRTVLDKIHGFDTTIVFYGEDTDIARRAAKQSKTKFVLRLAMPTSARRFKWEGMIKTGYIYVINFFSQVLFHKPVTKTYKDLR